MEKPVLKSCAETFFGLSFYQVLIFHYAFGLSKIRNTSLENYISFQTL